ncbi:glycosyltransferase family A protein [Dryocola clanedunensis]
MNRMSVGSYDCTVVLPVYNEEHNIKDCLIGFSKHLNSNHQLIIVDDGSTDNTAQITSRYIVEHDIKNFELITKTNSGAAKARLEGIKIAKSEFIAFVDCDDAIDEETIERALSEFINRPEIDLVLFDYYSIGGTNKATRFKYSINEWPISGLDAFKNTIDCWGIHAFGIYRKKIILDGYLEAFKLLSNAENNINDDELIARCSMLKSQQVMLSTGRYYYSDNPLSTTRRVNEKLYRMIYTALVLKRLISSNINLHDLIPAVDLYILRVLTNLSLKHYKWRRVLCNYEYWSDGIAKGLSEIHFQNIVKSTYRKPTLLIWSILKYVVLQVLYGCRSK